MGKAILYLIERKKSRDGKPKKVEKPMSRDFVNLVTSISKTDKGNGYIFVGHKGKPIKNPPKGFDRMRKHTGIADLKMRDLRRTSASTLLAKGASLPAIQRHLGHTKLSMTEEYLLLDSEQVRGEIEKLDGYFVMPEKVCGEKMVRKGQKESLPISEEAYNA